MQFEIGLFAPLDLVIKRGMAGNAGFITQAEHVLYYAKLAKYAQKSASAEYQSKVILFDSYELMNPLFSINPILEGPNSPPPPTPLLQLVI